MGLLATIFGGGVAEPIKAVGNIIDNVFTSKDEVLTHEEVLLRIAQRPGLVNQEINKVEAQHRSRFVAGWRPFIGWVCGSALAYNYLLPSEERYRPYWMEYVVVIFLITLGLTIFKLVSERFAIMEDHRDYKHGHSSGDRLK